jgi:hypothetical protein
MEIQDPGSRVDYLSGAIRVRDQVLRLVKGTGFSPYVQLSRMNGALATEGCHPGPGSSAGKNVKSTAPSETGLSGLFSISSH